MTRSWINRACAAAVAVWWMTASPMLAQCTMCRTVAAAQGESAKVLDAAIVVLFLPAMALFGGIVLMAFRYRGTPRNTGPFRIEEAPQSRLDGDTTV